MKSITKAVFVLTIFSVISKLLGFAFRIFLSHSIGEQGMAIYQIAISLFFVLLTVVASGIPSVISRRIAVHNAKQEYSKSHSLITSALIVVSVLTLLVVVLTIALKQVFLMFKIDEQAINILFLMLPAFVFSAFQNVFRGFIWGKSDFFKMSLIDLIEQVCRISLCILLSTNIFNISCIKSAAISLDIACFISMLISAIYYIKHKGKIIFNKQDAFYLLKSSTPITAVRMVGSLVQPVTAVIMPLMLVRAGFEQSTALSLYGAATGMVLPMLYLPSTFIGALAQALFPDLSSKMAVNDKNAIVNQIKSSIVFTTIISLVLVPVFSALGYEIGKFLFDSEIAGQLLEMSAWIMLPLGLSNLSTSMLNAIGLEVKGFINYLIGTLILILSIIFLPKYIGINAVIVGMGLCMTVSAVLNVAMLSKKLNIKFKVFKTICILCASIIPIHLIIFNSFNVLKHILPTFINIFLSAGLGAVCYILLCIVFNIIKVSTIKNQFFKIAHKKI